ncbi:MAG: hypothetical protein MSH58_10545 [Clostridiales bacterium]|nr:hypothetical protein [Clostridiales bacterium]
MAEKKKRRSPRPRAKERSLAELLRRNKRNRQNEFRPDPATSTWLKTRKLTRQQRLRLFKWLMYALIVIMSLVIQDVIMSQLRLFGATTDLAVGAILLITVIEGTDVGSLFVFIASILYWFSGSSPTPVSIILLTALGIGATMFRQMFWHRSRGTLTLCACLALTAYELGLFVTGLMQGLTYWGRLPSFLLTSVYTCLVMIPLYSLVYKTGLIGGNTWKE